MMPIREESIKVYSCSKIANEQFQICKQNQSSIQPIPCDAIRFLVHTQCLKETTNRDGRK
jgi:hypothetical protein